MKRKESIGPLLDGGVPYSVIGLAELYLLANLLNLELHWKILPIPKALNGHTRWKYEIGDHASASGKIYGGTVIEVMSENSSPFPITHLILEGSSKWVVCSSLTRESNISISTKMQYNSGSEMRKTIYCWFMKIFLVSFRLTNVAITTTKNL